MLRLPEPTLSFRGEDCRKFFKKHENKIDLLPEFMENLEVVLEDITRMQVGPFENPFRKIASIFTRITGQEIRTIISWMILYIIYFKIKEHAIFD
jgi:hypothetical protein